MDIDKLKYSKCPNCKKHGISAFLKLGRASTNRVSCKYCKKTYKVNWILAFIIKILIILALFMFTEYIYELSVWNSVILGIILLGVFQYFTPLEEIEEQNTGDGSLC